MVNVGLISAAIFYGIIVLYFFKTRKKWEVHGLLAIYRTKVGIKLMDKIANFSPRFLKVLGYFGVVIGFIGMAFTFVMLIKSALDLFLIKGAAPGFAPVLPGVTIPGLPTLGFWHWLIGIFVLATVHEFAHGILARVHKLKVKSSGFGLLGPILLAFVEPDEKKLSKSKKKEQLSVYAAGPLSNFIFAFIFALIFYFLLIPLSNVLYEPQGFVVANVTQGYDIATKNIELPFTISGINGINADDERFTEMFGTLEPGKTLSLDTDKGNYEIVTGENPSDSKKGYIGIQGNIEYGLKEKFGNYGFIFSRQFSYDPFF